MRVMEGGKRNKAVRDQGRRWGERVVVFLFLFFVFLPFNKYRILTESEYCAKCWKFKGELDSRAHPQGVYNLG